jgi:cation transport regulator ChaB
MADRADHIVLYAELESLPPAIRADLTAQAQQLYLDTFNSAWERYSDFADREAFCHRLARAALRRHERSSGMPPVGSRDAGR